MSGANRLAFLPDWGGAESTGRNWRELWRMAEVPETEYRDPTEVVAEFLVRVPRE